MKSWRAEPVLAIDGKPPGTGIPTPELVFGPAGAAQTSA